MYVTVPVCGVQLSWIGADAKSNICKMALLPDGILTNSAPRRWSGTGDSSGVAARASPGRRGVVHPAVEGRACTLPGPFAKRKVEHEALRLRSGQALRPCSGQGRQGSVCPPLEGRPFFARAAHGEQRPGGSVLCGGELTGPRQRPGLVCLRGLLLKIRISLTYGSFISVELFNKRAEFTPMGRIGPPMGRGRIGCR